VLDGIILSGNDSVGASFKASASLTVEVLELSAAGSEASPETTVFLDFLGFFPSDVKEMSFQFERSSVDLFFDFFTTVAISIQNLSLWTNSEYYFLIFLFIAQFFIFR